MPRTLADVLTAAAGRWPSRTAVHVDDEEPLRYADLLTQASRFAATLDTRHPDARHVGLLLPNTSRWVVALYGTALAGRTAVLLNPRLRDPELVYQVIQSGTDVLVAAAPPGRGLDSLIGALADDDACPAVVRADDEGEWAAWMEGQADLPPGPAADDTAVIIYTSGTTALPKGVMLSHGSVVGNADRVGARFGASEEDRIFCAGPFFHSGGLTMHVVLSAVFGAAAHSVPAFDADRVLDIVEREQITLYSGIETLFLRLGTAPGFAPGRLRSVRTGWATGTPAILASIADEIGVPGVIGVYGISEASPNVLMSDWTDSREHRLTTIGRPQDGTECAVVDPGTGRPVEPGQPGELIVRGPGLMQGYYGKPEETAEALREGWLHTGDLVVRREDGYFTFAGRIKDIVRTGGENVSCAEVEDALYRLGGIELAAVVGMDDPQHGQIPVAAVTLSAGAGAFSESELITRLRADLAGYKVPRRVVHLAAMPLTDSGKVQKGRLRDELAPLL